MHNPETVALLGHNPLSLMVNSLLLYPFGVNKCTGIVHKKERQKVSICNADL